MSWKQYGGAKNLETNRKITTNTVVADEIVLKSSYIGAFTINGILDVTGKGTIQGNLEVYGYLKSSDISTNNITVNGTSFFNGPVKLNNDVDILNNMHIGNTLTIDKSLTLKNNMTIGNLMFFNNDQYFFGNRNGVGINTIQPSATIDICSNRIEALNIYSNNSKNVNILSRNMNNKGIVLTTNNVDDIDDSEISNVRIDFFVNTTIQPDTGGDGFLKYTNDGLLEINARENIVALSKMALTYKRNEISDHLYNETLVIYDISKQLYKTQYYNNLSYTGNALTLVANDNSSNTFINLVTPNKNGLGIGGGSYTHDTTKNMGTFGVLDISGEYNQNQLIVSSSNIDRYKTILGINTYKPLVDKYVTDINGPIHIANSDINVIKSVDFQINSINNCVDYPNFIVAAGSSIDISGSYRDASGKIWYRKYIYVSNDYGINWNSIDITTIFGLGNVSKLFDANDIFVYDNSYAFIACDKSFILYTPDSGISWASITIYISKVTNSPYSSNDYYFNFKKIIVNKVNNIFKIYVTGIITSIIINSDSKNQHFYLNFTIPIYNTDGNILLDGSTNITTQQAIPTKQVTNNDTTEIDTSYKIDEINAGRLILPNLINANVSVIINSFDLNSFDVNSQPYFATDNGIQILSSDATILSINYDISKNIYNTVKINNNQLIGVGNNIISICNNINNTSYSFINLYYPNNSFNRIFSFNNSIYFTISNYNSIWITINGGISWQPINTYYINQSGKEKSITDPSNNLKNIIIGDENSLLLTNIKSTYSNTTYGKTDIISCFLPNLLNKINNHVIDICGNMRLDGDFIINENGKIISNNDTFYLLNENVNTLNIGGNASSVIIGNTTSGNTVVRNNFNVNLNTLFNGNVVTNGIQTFLNTTNSSDISSGSVILNGGIAIRKNTNIGSNLKVLNNTNLNTLVINNDTNTYGNLFINSFTSSTSSTTGSIVVNGGVGINENLNVLKNTQLTGNLIVLSSSELNNVNINGGISSTSITSGSLTVTGGVGISENLNIGQNLIVSQNSNLNTVNVVTLIDCFSITIKGLTLDKYYVDLINDQTVSGTKTFINNMNITNNNDSGNTTTGALTVTGGVGIEGNVSIGNNINLTGYINPKNGIIIDSSANILTNGNLFINSNVSSSSTTTGSLIVTGGIGVSENMNIGNDTIIGNDTNIYGNLFVNKNISIGKTNPNVQLDVSGSITTSGILTTDFVNSTGILNIGAFNDSLTKQINIGTSNTDSVLNLGTGTQSVFLGEYSNSIYVGNSKSISVEKTVINIGGKNDITYLRGNVIIENGTRPGFLLVNYSKYILLGMDTCGNQVQNLNLTSSNEKADGAGIVINSLGIANAGQAIVSSDLNGYLFKAPTYQNINSYNYDASGVGKTNYQYNVDSPKFPSQNILKLDVNNLTMNYPFPKLNPSTLVVLQPAGDNESRYKITSSTIDISNILIKEFGTDPNIQTIPTNVVINGSLTTNSDIIANGNVNLNASLYSNGFTFLKTVGINKVDVIGNTCLDINGNAIIKRLGVGTSYVNPEENSLEVQGNIFQQNGGFIWQF